MQIDSGSKFRKRRGFVLYVENDNHHQRSANSFTLSSGTISHANNFYSKSLNEYEITAHPSDSIYSSLVHLIPFVGIIERSLETRRHGESPRSYSLAVYKENFIFRIQFVFVFPLSALSLCLSFLAS
jgi:hypothetical protein